jgi:hypothetical protein
VDVHAALDELRASLGVDEVALWCWSSRVVETVWVTSHDVGLCVMAAQDAIFASHRIGLETGEGWSVAVLDAARRHELPFSEQR